MYARSMFVAAVLAFATVPHIAKAETPHERSMRIQKVDKEVFAREHEIAMERKANKISKEQAIKEEKDILEMSKREHAK